jgi:TM2 domain-containing membrane protein YozV
MLVAPQHVDMRVACPNCRATLEPWRVVRAAPPSAPRHAEGAPRYPGRLSSRSKVAAGVLGILLGWLGVHRFYLGFPGIGILQILVSIVTGGVGGFIWGLIEGILCLTGQMRDVDGLPLRD